MKRLFTFLAASLVAATVAGATPTIRELFGFPFNSSTGYPDGSDPNSLIQGSDGNLYGTAYLAGGSVFKITPAGQFTLLYRFAADPTTGHFPNGEYPGSLVEGPDGFLYGVAASGGQFSGLAVSQPGNIFKVSKSGTGFEIVHNFCSAPNCADGALPGSLILALDGNFYGTTSGGGSFQGQNCQSFGCGVVFRLGPSGTYSVLHTVNGTTEGSRLVGITQGNDGNFYGPSSFAAGAGASFFAGVFKMTPGGQLTTIHTFPAPQTPVSRLIQASNGLLYGALYYFGGTTEVIYQISTAGQVESIHQIAICCVKQGFSKVIEASDGNLWVTNPNVQPWGTVYSITPTGTLLQTVAFSGTNGAAPNSLIQASSGVLYGTTYNHGTDSQGHTAFGTVFSLDAGLPPLR